MEALLVKVAIGSVMVLIGWLHTRQTTMSRRIDELNERKLDIKSFHEVRSDLKEILKQLTHLQVEQAVWRGRMEERQDSNKHV